MHSRTAAMFPMVLTAVAGAQSGWTQLQPTTVPPARGWHQLAFDLSRSVTVMFGGISAANFGDTWEWNGSNWLPRTTANAPPPRWGHAMAYDVGTGRVMLFGGAGFADTWSYDGTNWTDLQPTSSPPTRQMGAMAWLSSRNSLILFGGRGTAGQVADTWELRNGNWAQLTPPSSPSLRESHSMASDWGGGQVLLFGGWSGSELNDLWAFDGNDWTMVGSLSAGPPGFGNTALGFDLGSGLAVQFGGFTNGGGTFSDRAWVHDGRQWIEDTRPTGPSGRRSFSLAYDPTRNSFLMFGGNITGYLNDTWEFRSGRPATWQPFGSACMAGSTVPVLRTQGATRPMLGINWALELTAAAGGVAAFVHGLSTTDWNGNQLPFDMTAFGMPGCRLFVRPDTTTLVTPMSGIARQAVSVPRSTTLLGVQFASQGFVLAPGSNALGVAASNAGVATIGEY
ncbi:MAG: hypothetical protein IPK26_16340 [Planctomycetes bacterium]|nr:hypothetical protein [Planctomycetota bacterium]